MSLADRYRRWFEYEKDSHAKVLASLNAIPTELRSAASFQKALQLMAHIVAARRLWLFRLGAASEGPRELFPKSVSMAELASQVDAMHASWSDYLGRLDDGALAREFEYRSLEGDWYRNSVEDVFTQLFGHSWYHRGQIAALVRATGGEPAMTDFVLWTREPLPQAEASA